MNFKLLLIGFIVLSIIATACSIQQTGSEANETGDNIMEQQTPQENIEQIIDLSKTCASLGGNWLSEFDECEGISADDCNSLGGTFNECASACRHDPNATVCTLQCVQVCSFD